MHSRFVTVLAHQLHLLEWGELGAAPRGSVFMAHGLTRTAHDFEHVGDHLHAQGFHCIAVDMIGRGLSTWAAPDRAEEEYTNPFYIKLVAALFETIGLRSCAWIGTSMGGLIGYIGIGSGVLRPYITRIVINDIGPHVPLAALQYIGTYTATMPAAPTAAAIVENLRRRMVSFGDIPEPVFQRMTIPYIRRRDDGQFTFHYDERILAPLRRLLKADPAAASAMGVGGETADPAAPMWDLLALVDVPMLLFRGETSDLLLAEDAQRMVSGAPQRQLVTVPRCGHAPMLFEPQYLDAIASFLTH